MGCSRFIVCSVLSLFVSLCVLLSVVGDWLLALAVLVCFVCCSLCGAVVRRSLLAAGCGCTLFVACCSLCAARCSLFVVCCCSLPFAVDGW